MDLSRNPLLQEGHTMLALLLTFPFMDYDGGIFRAELGLLCRNSANIGA